MGRQMGEKKKEGIASSEPKGAADQPSMVVGKIPSTEGLWKSLESVSKSEAVRNGVLVLFSKESSGRIGLSDNQYITGAVLDATGETGLDALKQLLDIRTGMFGFRPCLADELSELEQSLSFAVPDLLSLHARTKDLKPSAALDQLANKDTAQPAAPSNDSPLGYLDWSDSTDNKDPEQSLSLRRILMPALPQSGSKDGKSKSPDSKNNKDSDKDGKAPDKDRSTNEFSPANQLESDLNVYRKILQEEEDKVRQDIERAMKGAVGDESAQKTLDELNLLAGLLQSQSDLIDKKWVGLDDIPTPKAAGGGRPSAPASPRGADPRSTYTHLDSTGVMRDGAPRRSTKEMTKDLQGLMSQTGKMQSPKEFLKLAEKEEDDEDKRELHWLNQPKYLALTALVLIAVMITGISTSFKNAAVGSLLTEGKQLLKEKQWEAAASSFDEVINKDAGCARAFYYRGIAYAQTRQNDKAEKDFDQAAKLGMQADRIALAKAGLLFRKDDWNKVLEICTQQLADGKKTAEIYRLKAACYQHLNDFSGAINACDAALQLTKDPAQMQQIYTERGYAYFQNNQCAKALADYNSAMQIKSNAQLYLLRAGCNKKMRNFTAAVADYDRVLASDTDNYEAYVSRGMCKAQLHQEDAALKDFTRALAVNRTGVEALIQRGSLHIRRQNYQQAVSDLEDARKLNPGIPEVVNKLSTVYRAMHKSMPKELISVAEPTTLKLPKDTNSLITLGYSYLNNGSTEEALECLTEAVRRVPNNPAARRYLAHACYRSGSSNSAAAQFEALSQLQRLTDEDVLIYARALEANDAKEKAAQVLGAAVNAGGSSALRAELANVYFTIGFAAKAAAICKEGAAAARTPAEKQMFLDMLKSPPTPGSRPGGARPGSNVEDDVLKGLGNG